MRKISKILASLLLVCVIFLSFGQPVSAASCDHRYGLRTVSQWVTVDSCTRQRLDTVSCTSCNTVLVSNHVGATETNHSAGPWVEYDRIVTGGKIIVLEKTSCTKCGVTVSTRSRAL